MNAGAVVVRGHALPVSGRLSGCLARVFTKVMASRWVGRHRVTGGDNRRGEPSHETLPALPPHQLSALKGSHCAGLGAPL
jgi:hypothetical protein